MLNGRYLLHSEATGINESAQIVGTCWGPGAGDLAGFIWQDGVLRDLDDLIDPKAEVRINLALAMNESGQIVGDTSGVDAVLLTPRSDRPGDLD